MRIIRHHQLEPHPGEMLRTVQARIRDGHFHYYVYHLKENKLPLLYLSDQYPKEMQVYLRCTMDLLYFENSHTMKSCKGMTPEQFAQLFFPQYSSKFIDPDYEAWWDGVMVEI